MRLLTIWAMMIGFREIGRFVVPLRAWDQADLMKVAQVQGSNVCIWAVGKSEGEVYADKDLWGQI